MLLLVFILFLSLPECSLPCLCPSPRTAGSGGWLDISQLWHWLKWLVCPSHDSPVKVNEVSPFYCFASRSVIWCNEQTKVVIIVLAPWKRLWCWQSSAAAGEEACAQADWEELDRGWSGERAGVGLGSALGYEGRLGLLLTVPPGSGHGCILPMASVSQDKEALNLIIVWKDLSLVSIGFVENGKDFPRCHGKREEINSCSFKKLVWVGWFVWLQASFWYLLLLRLSHLRTSWYSL